jgi:4a-hydroxytetrahydrobiopterin dehydratase
VPRLLTPEEVERQLRAIPGWRREPLSLRASYLAPDFPTAARLVAELAAEAEAMDHHPDVDLRWRTVTLRCATHSAGGITQLDVELAHRAHEWAERLGASAVEPPTRVELALDCVDPSALLPFWREALGYREVTVPDEASEGVDAAPQQLHDPRGSLPALWFQRMDPPRRERGRFHLDVFLPADEAGDRLGRLLALGGRVGDDSHAPSWWVVADPEGNEVCLCSTGP